MTTSQLSAIHSGLIGFLVGWPVVLLVQLAGRRSARAVASGAVVTLYACLVVAVVLLPLPGPYTRRPVHPIQLTPFRWVLDFMHGHPQAFTQVVLNVLLFVPLGVLARVLWRRNLGQVVVIGFACSLLIEVTQLTGNFGTAPFVYRIFDVDDLMTNTLGAAFGWAMANALVRVPDPVRAMQRSMVLAPLGQARSPEADHFHPAPRGRHLRRELRIVVAGAMSGVLRRVNDRRDQATGEVRPLAGQPRGLSPVRGYG